MIAQNGASVENETIVRKVLGTVRKRNNPIVIIWLGTCEITQKTGKYVKIRQYPYQNIEFILSEYRELKNRIKEINNTAKVIFLECPYYSKTRYNKEKALTPRNKRRDNINRSSILIRQYKSKRTVTISSNTDNNLCQQVDYYNKHPRIINRIKTPRLSQDIIISNKKATQTKVRYRKNWNAYNDGIHTSH